MRLREFAPGGVGESAPGVNWEFAPGGEGESAPGGNEELGFYSR